MMYIRDVVSDERSPIHLSNLYINISFPSHSYHPCYPPRFTIR